MCHFFLSYSRDDETIAHVIQRKLSRDLDVWLDTLQLRPSKFWQQEVDRAIADCDRMILLGSIYSFGSTQSMREISIGMAANKPICLLKIDPAPIPDWMESYEQLSVVDIMGNPWSIIADTVLNPPESNPQSMNPSVPPLFVVQFLRLMHWGTLTLLPIFIVALLYAANFYLERNYVIASVTLFTIAGAAFFAIGLWHWSAVPRIKRRTLGGSSLFAAVLATWGICALAALAGFGYTVDLRFVAADGTWTLAWGIILYGYVPVIVLLITTFAVPAGLAWWLSTDGSDLDVWLPAQTSKGLSPVDFSIETSQIVTPLPPDRHFEKVEIVADPRDHNYGTFLEGELSELVDMPVYLTMLDDNYQPPAADTLIIFVVSPFAVGKLKQLTHLNLEESGVEHVLAVLLQRTRDIPAWLRRQHWLIGTDNYEQVAMKIVDAFSDEEPLGEFSTIPTRSAFIGSHPWPTGVSTAFTFVTLTALWNALVVLVVTIHDGLGTLSFAVGSYFAILAVFFFRAYWYRTTSLALVQWTVAVSSFTLFTLGNEGLRAVMSKYQQYDPSTFELVLFFFYPIVVALGVLGFRWPFRHLGWISEVEIWRPQLKFEYLIALVILLVSALLVVWSPTVDSTPPLIGLGSTLT